MTPKQVLCGTLLCCFFLPARGAAQTQQTFDADRDAEIDNLLTGSACGGSVGGADAARVGVQDKGTIYRTLLHFDLSSIPHEATISDAVLHLYVEQLTQGLSFKIDITRLTNPGWKELEANWDVYDCDNDGTESDPAFAWCAAGGDFTTADAAAWWTSGVGDSAIPIAALVQKAVGKPGVPHDPDTGGQLHLLLKAAKDLTETDIERWVRVRTHENTQSGTRPRLEVQWTMPTPPPGATPTPTPAWVSFRDETADRLELTTVPVDDGEEKDIAVGDFDDDGDDDIIVVRKKPFLTQGPRKDLLLLNDDGVLRDRSDQLPLVSGSPVTTDARDVVVTDLDGQDGDDLVIATTCQDTPKFYRNKGGRCANWLGFQDMTASWEPRKGTCGSNDGPCNYETPALRFCGVGAGDVTGGDTAPDLYFASYSGGCGGGMSNAAEDVFLVNKIGDPQVGRFIVKTGDLDPMFVAEPPNGLGFGTTAAIRDLDNDQDNDIVKGAALSVKFVRNSGDPAYTFSAEQHLPAVGFAYAFAAGNLNNTQNNSDSLDDFYVVTDHEDEVYIANSDGSFTKTPLDITRVNGLGGNVKLGDVDGDKDLDVGVADVDVNEAGCGINRTFALLQNDGIGGMSDPYTSDQNFHTGTFDFAFIDINQDGCSDLFMGICKGYKVLIQNCPPTGG